MRRVASAVAVCAALLLMISCAASATESSPTPGSASSQVEIQGATTDAIDQSTPAARGEALYLTPFRLAVLVAISIGALAVLALLLAFQDGRRTVVKLFYLARNLIGVDVGLRGVVQLGLYSALPAIGVAFTKGYGDRKQKGFQWHSFWVVFLVISAVGIVVNVFNRSMNMRRVLSPGAGGVWRAERKSATAAIIQRINCLITRGPASLDDVKAILRDLLDVVVLHVRDHRGSFRDERSEVFANLLLVDGDELVVVARDKVSHSTQYQRPVPARYPKATMLCGRAIESKKVLSVGLLAQAYPEGPTNKPYKSILAMPLFSARDDVPYGALSIDCSRPYFFESFIPGQAENDLENSLQPYIHLITLVLEALVSTEWRRVVRALAASPPAPVPNGGKS